eukprot:scaffold484086_cov18-Prasinocladus_malaysianus.AAC.1
MEETEVQAARLAACRPFALLIQFESSRPRQLSIIRIKRQAIKARLMSVESEVTISVAQFRQCALSHPPLRARPSTYQITVYGQKDLTVPYPPGTSTESVQNELWFPYG